jgi:hypothetical protein
LRFTDSITISDANHYRPEPACDEQLAARASAILQQAAYAEIRGVACDARDNVLRLSGSVSKYFYKQVAQAILIDRLPGPLLIENHLCVEFDSALFRNM